MPDGGQSINNKMSTAQEILKKNLADASKAAEKAADQVSSQPKEVMSKPSVNNTRVSTPQTDAALKSMLFGTGNIVKPEQPKAFDMEKIMASNPAMTERVGKNMTKIDSTKDMAETMIKDEFPGLENADGLSQAVMVKLMSKKEKATV